MIFQAFSRFRRLVLRLMISLFDLVGALAVPPSFLPFEMVKTRKRHFPKTVCPRPICPLQFHYLGPIRGLVRCMSAGFWLLGIPIAFAQPISPIYSVEGVLTYKQINANPSSPAHYTQSWLFTLMADKIGRWKCVIQTKSPDLRLPVESRQEFAYDGTNIYAVVYSPQVVLTSPGSSPKIIPSTNEAGAAEISSGPYPTDYGGAMGIIWLAYLGGQYLDPSNTTVSFPNLTVANARTDPMAWSCDFQYSLVRSDPRFIRSGTFHLKPDLLYENSIKYPELDEPVSDAEYDEFIDVVKGYRTFNGDSLLRTVYTLDQTNVLDGIPIPTRFHADLPPIATNYPSFRVEGVVTNLLPIQRLELMPALKGLTRVVDHRFRVKKESSWRRNVFYLLDTNGWITDTNDSRIQTVLTKTPLLLRVTQSKTIARYGVVRFIFGIMVAVPLAIILVRLWRQRRPQKGAKD